MEINNTISNSEPINKIDCSDIYLEETNSSIKSLKHFREAWLRSTVPWNSELFQYADSDFYFYRYAIDREEKGTEPLLKNILYKVMERYGVNFEISNNKNAPFAFIVCEKKCRIGYRFKDFYPQENINRIVKIYRVNEAVILRALQQDRSDERITEENEQYRRDGLKLKALSLKDFFGKYFGLEEYNSFISYVEKYLQEMKELTGYKPIKFLSSMNYAAQRLYEEKVLADWDYFHYTYQIIDSSNEKVQDYLYLTDTSFPSPFFNVMENKYLAGELSKAMIGSSEFAESFLTSEWLYHSLKGKKNFDYTSVISGYLKSVEQLLYRIVMLNVDNPSCTCKITMSGEKRVIKEAKRNRIVTYRQEGENWEIVPITDKGFKYIELTETQIEYMDSSIGTFERFLRNNPHIFEDSNFSKTIADMICCFRIECRNGFFHTHNLKEWDVVEMTRSNAIFLYFVLLGGCVIPDGKEKNLGIISADDFDELCKKIREFRNFNLKFIFEYADGKKLNLVYDIINNTAEYDNGVEHYESLLFFDVGEFAEDTYEKLDEGIKEEQKVYLTRNNLPHKIFGVHRNHELEEIIF